MHTHAANNWDMGSIECDEANDVPTCLLVLLDKMFSTVVTGDSAMTGDFVVTGDSVVVIVVVIVVAVVAVWGVSVIIRVWVCGNGCCTDISVEEASGSPVKEISRY